MVVLRLMARPLAVRVALTCMGPSQFGLVRSSAQQNSNATSNLVPISSNGAPDLQQD